MRRFLTWLLDFLLLPSEEEQPKIVMNTPEKKPERVSAATNQPSPLETPKQAPKLLFDTPQNARHSVRVICDELLPIVRNHIVDGKAYLPKDIICACIEQESGFKNTAKGVNRDQRGNVISIDWGICQFNDTPGWYVGPGLPFESSEDIVENPEKAVRLMVRMYKAGQIKKWVSYTSGAYKKYLPYA